LRTLSAETIRALHELIGQIDDNVATLDKAMKEFQDAKRQAETALEKLERDRAKLLSGKAAILKDLGA